MSEHATILDIPPTASVVSEMLVTCGDTRLLLSQNSHGDWTITRSDGSRYIGQAPTLDEAEGFAHRAARTLEIADRLRAEAVRLIDSLESHR